NPAYLAELLTQIARAEGLQRKFEDAHRTLDEADRLAGEAPVPRIRCFLERGRALNSAKQPSDAKPLFIQAFDLAKAHGEEALALDAAHMVAIVETPEKAIWWSE